ILRGDEVLITASLEVMMQRHRHCRPLQSLPERVCWLVTRYQAHGLNRIRETPKRCNLNRCNGS
ncbi:MAG: hypothetical protein KDJ34_11075, partial [Candidatus Competibacteraceae bacterium]|nr:hypothetical protein [Candidatus Competibacteraceae bacterium]